MSRPKNRHKNKGKFAGIPKQVIHSDAFKSLGGNSAKLLMVLANQYNYYNNGDLAITQSIVGEWITKNTMYSAKDELYQKGFIVINAFGGRSACGRKLASLYALTWQPIDDLKIKNNEIRFTHYPTNKLPLHYWKSGENPDYKTKKERDAQYKRDIKKIRKANTYF